MARKEGLHKEDIKAAIRKRGKTMRQLSLDAGLADSTVRSALFYPCRRAEQAISDFIEVPLHDIWPDRYDSNGKKIKAPRGSKTIVKKSGRVTAKKETAD